MTMATVMIVAQVASAVAGVISAVNASKAASAQAAINKAMIEENRRQARVEALNEEAQRRNESAIILGLADAQAGGRGIDPLGSPSFQAIQTESRRVASEDVQQIQLLNLRQNRQFDLGIAAENISASLAKAGIGTSIISGIGTIGMGVAKASTLGGPKAPVRLSSNNPSGVPLRIS